MSNSSPGIVPQDNLATLTATSWRDTLPIHPACELVPPMSADELPALGEDIVTSGRLTADIALWQADPNSPLQLLDGRSRLDALEMVIGKPVEINPPSLVCGDFLALNRVIVLDGRFVDPYAYVISANLRRRSLTPEQRQDALIKLIALTPKKSDHQIAKKAGVDHKTIAKARAKGVDVGIIPHVSTRIDTKGRKQPAKKEKGSSLAATHRQLKLADELSKIKNTSLDTPAEKDALIELKQLDKSCAAGLVTRAAQGEAVSAAAEIDKRRFKPQPDAAKLMEVFNRHLLRVWVRATPAARRQWLKNLEENVDLDTSASMRREAAA